MLTDGVYTDSKLSIMTSFPSHPPTNPAFLAGPWPSDAAVYTSDQWPDDSRGSAHAYPGSSFYPLRVAYPAGQPEIDSASGFPGNAPGGRNMKLKSEHPPVVGVC